MILINSEMKPVDAIKLQEYSELEIKNEPMLFNCDLEHAQEYGGPITKAFLARLPEGWHDIPVVVDTRVHMLMPGWFPCIPGWHHDDVPRTREDGQPNYEHGQNRSQHIMAVVNGDICPTEFAIGTAYFPEILLGNVCYEQWHKTVENCVETKSLKKIQVPSNTLVHFDDRTWHRGTAAIKNGWRWFGRVSRYFTPAYTPIDRGNPRTNEVRKQVQVYLGNVNGGW